MRILSCSSVPSRRVLESCGVFGLLVRHDAGAWHRHLEGVALAAGEIDDRLGPGGVALLTGASGCGKSTLLRALAGRCGVSGVWVDSAALDEARPLADLFDGPVESGLRLLTRAGLADPTLLVRRAAELSEGQRSRLAIALAMQAASDGAQATVLIDELAASLDEVTARTTCAMLARWVRRSGHRLIAATPRSDMASVMCPEVHWTPGHVRSDQ